MPPAPKQKIKILHVVKWFYAGGAERILSSILAHSDGENFEHVVLSLSDQNERLGNIRQTLNIPYTSFELVPGKFDFAGYLKCFRFVRQTRPDMIKTWLPPANIAGGIMAKLLCKPLIWGVHNVTTQKPYPRDVQQQRKLSGILPDTVVCCSKPVYDNCHELGFEKSLLTIINNGTDTELFCYRPEGRERIRSELGIAPDTVLIGMAAEFTKVKRHSNFLAAAKLFLLSCPNAHFLFCGKFTSNNAELEHYLEILEMKDRVHVLGIRDDMPDIYSALDIHTLNSQNESFGLAVTEALACETLCAATDVGIMKEILEDVGLVYPVCNSPDPLVDAWKYLLVLPEEEKRRRREKGRVRVVEQYSIIHTAKAYDDLYERVAARKAA